MDFPPKYSCNVEKNQVKLNQTDTLERMIFMNEFKGSKDYVASEELLRAANIAMVLQKPLLIKGEPGTGKTVLAEAISEAMGKKLIIWNIKSTTKAQDGLYVYDVVQRL